MNNIIPIEPETMIERAIDKGVTVETLERLLEMRNKIKAEQAREAYYSALSSFQSQCPPIRKERVVKGKGGDVRYKYANLDDIVSQVAPILHQNGLSYTIKTEFKEGFVIAECVVHHTLGHSTSSSFPVPVEKEAFMNEAQKLGSAQQYAKRYAFCNAFGIVTSDQDDDAQASGSSLDANQMYAKFAQYTQAFYDLHDSIKAIKEGIAARNYEKAAEAWMELTNEQKQSIWLAPTKGGVFTTEERSVIKSDEFAQVAKAFAEPNQE